MLVRVQAHTGLHTATSSTKLEANCGTQACVSAPAYPGWRSRLRAAPLAQYLKHVRHLCPACQTCLKTHVHFLLTATVQA